MRILFVGGTGMIGSHAALHLAGKGHDVVLAARNAPPADAGLQSLPFLRGSYIDDDFGRADLAGFDALVFAAGNDIRHIPEGGDAAEHYRRANTEAVPRFVAAARDAGVGRAVYIGSFYSHAAPHLADSSPYVKSRHEADARVRALATPGFSVCSLSAPIIVGSIPGLVVPFFDHYIRYALGELGVAPTAPPGGSNFLSTLSLAEAVEGALLHGQAGRAYLIGDETLSYREYFQLFFDAVGSGKTVETVDSDHPLMPDNTLFAGRGNWIRYEPDAGELALLGYRRQDVRRAVEDLVVQYRLRRPT